MKTLLLTSSLTLSLLFSAGSWAEWTVVAKNADGTKVYVDFDRIKKVNGLVYYWRVHERLEPFKESLSTKVYSKADCETMREMVLSHSEYRLPMAEGDAMVTFTPPAEWGYVPPDSIGENTVQAVCAH
jgi:hypothetical protein